MNEKARDIALTEEEHFEVTDTTTGKLNGDSGRWTVEVVEDVASELARMNPPASKEEYFDPRYWGGLAHEAIKYLDARRKGCEQSINEEGKQRAVCQQVFPANHLDPFEEGDIYDRGMHVEVIYAEICANEAADKDLAAMHALPRCLAYTNFIKLVTGINRPDRAEKAFKDFLLYESEKGTWLQRAYYPVNYTPPRPLEGHTHFENRPIPRALAHRLCEGWIESLRSTPIHKRKALLYRDRFRLIRPLTLSTIRAAAGAKGLKKQEKKKKSY